MSYNPPTRRALHYQPCFARIYPGFSALRRLESGPTVPRIYALFTNRWHKNRPLLWPKTNYCGKPVLKSSPRPSLDHNVVVLRLSIPTMWRGWGRGPSKMNSVMVTETAVKVKIRCAWARWRRRRHWCWWINVVEMVCETTSQAPS